MELSLIDAPVTLTTELIDIESPSHHEAKIADVIEAALRDLEAGSTGNAGNVSVERFGNTLVARTHFAKAQRVVLAGHVDTVPLADNTPHHFEDTPRPCAVWLRRGGYEVRLGVLPVGVCGAGE